MQRPYLVALGGAVFLASTLAASSPSPEVMWRLPEAIDLDAAAGTEGRVRFDHATHLAFVGARCTACHPEAFRMLGPTGRIVHDEMDAGRSCGICHDGERAPATGSEEACTTCHTGWGPRDPGMLRDVSFSGSDSPGEVVFSHASHAGAGLSCSRCHPDPFALRLAGTAVVPPPAGGHRTCGRCHDGGDAFDLEEAPCESCHRQEVSP